MSLTSSPTVVTLLADRTYISEDYCWYVSLQCYETEMYLLYVQYYCLFYFTLQWRSLAILTERDFVGEGVGQSLGCETAQGDQHSDYGLLV